MGKKIFSTVFISVLLLSIISVTSLRCANAEPKTWTVDDDGPADFRTIQEAINAANESDIIFVRNGTYCENVVVNKTLLLVGENKSATIIDGNRTGTVMHVIANNTAIRGFTIRESGEKFDYEPAIWCGVMVGDYETPVVNTMIDNNSIKSNYIGVFLWFSLNSTVIDNNIENSTNGVWLANCIWNNIGNNTVSNNDVGIGASYASQNFINSNTVASNKLVGLVVDDSSLNTIDRNCIENNGFGISLSASTGNIIYHNNFMNNTKQVDATPAYANVWDDDYPSGGNYWSNYNGTDVYSGSFQNETGPDGIGDTHHVIDENNIDRYPLMKPWTMPEHDLHVVEVYVGRYFLPTQVYTGQIVDIKTFIRNEGKATETFNVTCYMGDFPVGTSLVSNLTSGDSKFLKFIWNTTNLTACRNYTISVVAEPIAGETILENNRKTILVKVNMMGDVNGDGWVNIVDIAKIARVFGKLSYMWDYDINCDLNLDDIINIVDIAMAARNFGKTCG